MSVFVYSHLHVWRLWQKEIFVIVSVCVCVCAHTRVGVKLYTVHTGANK